MIQEKYILSWKINNFCNFHCDYCFLDNSIAQKTVNIHSVISTLGATNKAISVHFTGGEPFLYPGFVNMCEKISKKHDIFILTNLSDTKKIKSFIKKVSPKKASFLISLHIEERERRKQMDVFLKNVQLLKHNGYPFKITYVLHPRCIDRFEETYDFFKTEGILIIPKLFRGFHDGKKYPESYSEEDLELMRKYEVDFEINYPLSSKHLCCNAGHNFLRVWPDGRITRCIADKTSHGHIESNIFFDKTSKRCNVDLCKCFGRNLISYNLFTKSIVNMRDFIHYGRFLSYSKKKFIKHTDLNE